MAKTNGKDVQNKLQHHSSTQGSFTAVMQSELKKVFPAIKTIVPKHMTPERLARMALTTISRTPRLAQCSPASLVGAVVNCAVLGLEPNLVGHAYLVPYWNSKTRGYECQFQIGYKGYIELIRRTGEVSQIYARPVYENDLFVYLYGEENTLVHVPFDMLEHLESYSPNGQKGLLPLLTAGAIKDIRKRNAHTAGEISKYYAAYKLKDGSFGFQVLTREQAHSHAQKFSSSKKNGQLVGPWSDHFDAMALKTAIKEMVKYMPISVEIQEKLATDEAVVKPNLEKEEGDIFDVDFTVVQEKEPAEGENEQVESTAPRKESKALAEEKPEPAVETKQKREKATPDSNHVEQQSQDTIPFEEDNPFTS